MRLKRNIVWTLLPALCCCTGLSVDRSMDAAQRTVGYSYGIGRITWTFPKGLETTFAVPHFTAGPRIKCTSKRYECDIEVGPRDISITNEERLGQLEVAVKPLVERTSEKTFKPFAHGKDKSVIYVTLHDRRSSASFRYLTFGYSLKGPAVIKFEARTNDAIDTIAILDLVHTAKATDALGMWALRFGDYKAACEERFPAYGTANEKAFNSSPFATVDITRFFMQLDPSLTLDDANKALGTVRVSFAESFDKEPKDKRQSLCEGFPRWIDEAAKDVEAK